MAHPGNKPPIAKDPISAAIPVHNRASEVDKAVSAWREYLGRLDREFELIVVDDGSTDDTAKHVEAIVQKHPEVKLLRHDTTKGFGACLRTALAQARYPLFFYTALDYPYHPGDLRRLLERIDDTDLVSGFRSALREPGWVATMGRAWRIAARILMGVPLEKKPGWLGWGPHTYAWLAKWMWGVHVRDIDSAFKLIRKELFARMPIQSNGDFVHTEILAKANFMTSWMDEVPIGSTPGVPAREPPFRFGGRMTDARRMMRRPDFGPWPLPTEPPASAPVTQ